ncbi:Ftsk gamma domain protein [compost metagenome]
MPHNKDDIAKNNEKTKYEVVGQSNIRVSNAVLDVGVGFQRDLAVREGVNVSEITVNQKQPEDERYRQAVDLARQSGGIAIPKLQNELSIGYGEARSLIDRMETEGLVSVYDGSKPQVYIGGQTKEVEPQKAAQDAQIQTDFVPEFLKRREERQAEVEMNNTEQEQQGKYERLEGTKIRVPRVTLDMENPEHRQLAESYGIKVNEIDFKRETSDLVIEKEEVKGRESLSEKLGAVGANRGDDDRTLIVRDLLQRLNTRMSLEDRRQQIKPLVEAQKQTPPVKNKNKERGGR